MQLERGSTAYFVSLARIRGQVEASWGGGPDKEYGVETFATVSAAREVYARKVAEKLADGYRDVSAIRHSDLEAALRARRDEVATRAVYADWLEEEGSPVAAFMRPPEQPPERIEEALGARFGWPGRTVLRLQWRAGFWRGLQLRDDELVVADRALLARELFGATACGALEELAIEQTFASSAAAVIAEAARHAWARDLSRFYLDADSRYPEEVEPIGAVGAAVSAAFPRLRSLELHTCQRWEGPEHVGLEGLTLPELEELWVVSTTEANLVALSRARLPLLGKLSISFVRAVDGDVERGGTLAALAPVLTNLPALRSLSVRTAAFADDLLAALPSLTPSLQHVALTRCAVGDGAAGALAKLPALASLVIDRCEVSPTAVDAIRAACPSAEISAG